MPEAGNGRYVEVQQSEMVARKLPAAEPLTALKTAGVKEAAVVPPKSVSFEKPNFDEDGDDASQLLADDLDRAIKFGLSKFTSGLSPAALIEAYMDWLIHLMAAPGKQMQIAQKATRKAGRLAAYMAQCGPLQGQVEGCIAPLPDDKRFVDPAWHQWPFNWLHQGFLLNQQWWHVATSGVHGVTSQHERQVAFVARQLLDMFSPSNFALTNPVVLAKTQAEGGQNLVRGFQNFMEDWQRTVAHQPPEGAENFKVGETVARTPGKVVFRNRLIELVQYAPQTSQVRPEPILIVPAWIMKYYILDLKPENSLIQYLVENGYTVFTISWLNPTEADRDLGLDDYRTLGVTSAVDAVRKITSSKKVHGVGYCLGGTLLAIAAAAYARNGDDPFATLSFFAAQVDFQEAGELLLFLSESQVAFLEDMMWEQGYLASEQMSGAFQMLRSNDLVWSRIVHDYLMGERAPMTDMAAWNADTTRMPAKMHSEYLRGLFLNNDLAAGRYLVDGKPIALTDIRADVFAVGAEKDHVAPWRSVYKFHLLLDTDVTFLLAKGGHNNGVVSAPGGHAGAGYRVATKRDLDFYRDPKTWMAETPTRPGSWWPAMVDWLNERSGAPVAPPPMGAAAKGLAPLADAPGTYVHQR